MTTEPTVTLVPLAALHPAPWNPRTIRDDRFKNLCDSITADPAFIWRRPILAQLDGTIYAGNMRYRAVEHLEPAWHAGRHDAFLLQRLRKIIRGRKSRGLPGRASQRRSRIDGWLLRGSVAAPD
jgi:hypothetical protein